MLHIAGLRKAFTLHHRDGVRLSVLRGLDLAVAGGECVVLGGGSGMGKSTLLRCIYGNYLPQAGQVLIRHGNAMVDIATADARTVLSVRERSLGWISQFLRVVPRVATLDIVAEPLLALGTPVEEARDQARIMLRRLKLPDRHLALPPATFSGGEQQRVNVARTLVVGFPVLLLDEPTSALDARNRDIVLELIAEARDRGAAIVGIFHDPAAGEAVATRTVDIEQWRANGAD